MLQLDLRFRRIVVATLAVGLSAAAWFAPLPRINAADHGDAPLASLDRSADIGDTYVFLDPNDNNRIVLIQTVQGFIAPQEAVNFGIFDSNVRYRFELETTGDPLFDYFIDVTFSPKTGTPATPQSAFVTSNFFTGFSAPATAANLAPTPPAPTVTTDPGTGISFYAGVSDDPFFFDIPAFARFVASVNAGAPDPSFFNRARDSFAGYNTLTIAVSVPVARIQPLLSGAANNSLGVNARTARLSAAGTRIPGRFPTPPTYTNVDRAGIPAVNVALIPFPRKNEFNLATGLDDARGVFAGDIVATLTRFGTNATNIGILASVAVVQGDFLRLNLGLANTGPGGGNNAGAGFPNGRRLVDDVIDTILFFIANQNALGDNVNANDVAFRDTFPFVGAAQQPRDSGVDDNTRN
ncbi:MAG: DUF4331 family protein [Blastocatellales bacterium]|nr:DUF4331 family protein [Blastocatellales bacterium]